MSSRRQRITPTTEQTFGADDFLGVSKTFARQDHSHGTPVNPVDAHLTEADPHTQYQKESEKGAVNGYASLDAGGTVPDAQVPAGITRDTEAAATYAPIAKGVTNGDSHDHSGGDGGQISYNNLADLPSGWITDAPNDGKIYVRRNAAWEELVIS